MTEQIEAAILAALRDSPNNRPLFDAEALWKECWLSGIHMDVFKEHLDDMIVKDILYRVKRGGTYFYGINS